MQQIIRESFKLGTSSCSFIILTCEPFKLLNEVRAANKTLFTKQSKALRAGFVVSSDVFFPSRVLRILG